MVSAAAFAALAVLVEIGATSSFDVRAREYFRPDDVWGDLQIRVDTLVEGLKPERALPLTAVVVLAISAYRRSWRPATYTLLVLGVAGVPALATKVLVARSDPHHEMSSIGSYPSGHVLVLLTCLGAILMLLHRPAWWEWLLVAAVDAAMGLALLFQAAHWLTDVIGGVLLGVAALAATSGYAEPARAARRRDR